MIPEITEVNFPAYATLHQATVSFADMGDKLINTQVKIDGDIAPAFIGTDGKDWEVTFKGEKYIHPLRKPQATKSNESRYSLIDMTFYHWAIYQMKRYYFVSLANVQSGTPIADKYIVSMNLGLEDFARAIADILEFYFPDGEIYVYKSGDRYINPDLTDYDHQVKGVEISYTYIWDLLQKTQELYKCHWSLEQDNNGNYALKFGYPVTELTHVFEYGYQGGLLRLERQVQDANIRNQILGRGGEKNLPRLYFKDYEQFHPNSTDSAYSNYGQTPDPDAIPELENIYFSELRDSNFRSYVQGWKTNPNRQLTTPDGWHGTVETYDATRGASDWAYKKGHEDETFDPVEYVKDDDSIETYGLLQGGLENQDDIYPTIHGMKIELPCDKGAHDSLAAGHEVETLADEVVDVEPVLTDEISASDSTINKNVSEVRYNDKTTYPSKTSSNDYWTVASTSGQIDSYSFIVPEGYVAYVDALPSITATLVFNRTAHCLADSNRTVKNEEVRANIAKENYGVEQNEVTINSVQIYTTGGVLVTTGALQAGQYRVRVSYSVPATKIYKTYYDPRRSRQPSSSSQPSTASYTTWVATAVDYQKWIVSAAISYSLIPFDGILVSNPNATASATISASDKHEFSIQGDQFTVGADGAMVVEVPVSVTPKEFALIESTVHIVDTSTSEEVANANIPQGTYRLFVDVTVRNLDGDSSHVFSVTLGETYVYNVPENAQWEPTFDIWIKNIFDTDRTQFPGGDAGDEQYVASVWEPLVSSDEMAITFTTGNLSYSSDWEFKIASGGVHYDNSKLITVTDENNIEHTIRSEWRLTLIKSEAEADAIHKYIPYKDYNAVQGDRFFFTGIYLPWAYVYAAERELTATKEEALDKSKEVQPTWVVGLDKVRIQQTEGQEVDTLMNRIGVGDHVWVHDDRFTEADGVQLFISSITYTWPGNGEMVPDMEIVLTDEVQTTLSSVEQIRNDITVVSNQMQKFSNIERTIRRIGDAAYLRKDGIEEQSSSPTIFRREIQSDQFVSGLVGGSGWGAYLDEQGKSVIEVDSLIVRDDMHINNIVAHQITAIGGKEILSAASMVVSRVDATDTGYTCYYDEHEGSIGNLFAVGDIVMSQNFDTANQQTRYYRREVLAVGEGYITLSLDANSTGNATPQEGDVIVQYGNTTNANRQFVITRDVIGGGYEQMLSGLDSVSATGSEYYFAGGKDSPTYEPIELADLDGINLEDYDGNPLAVGTQTIHHIEPRWFVGDANGEYAQWENGELTVKGNIIVKRGSGVYSDIGYLANALPESSTIISGGVVLSKIIGVTDENDNLTAGINALDTYDDSAHGRLMIFAGAASSQTADIVASPFRVYADGHVEATDMVLNSGCKIGDFTIIADPLEGYSYIEADSNRSEARSASLAMTPETLTYYMLTTGTPDTTIGRVRVGMPLSEMNSGSVANPTGLLYINNSRPGGSSSGLNLGARILVEGGYKNHEGLRIGVYGDGSGIQNIGLRVDASGTSATNYAIYSSEGMFAGFRPNIVSLNTGNTSSNPYSDLYNIIICANTSSITQYLPSSPQKGQMYIVFHTTTSSLTINGNGKNIARAYGDGTSSGTTSLSVRQMVWLFYDGTQWITNYLSH